MTAGLGMQPAVEAKRIITAVLADLRSGRHRGVTTRPSRRTSAPEVPVLLVHGRDDRLVPVGQSPALASALVADRRLAARSWPIRLIQKPPELLPPSNTSRRSRPGAQGIARVADKVANLGGPSVIMERQSPGLWSPTANRGRSAMRPVPWAVWRDYEPHQQGKPIQLDTHRRFRDSLNANQVVFHLLAKVGGFRSTGTDGTKSPPSGQG